MLNHTSNYDRRIALWTKFQDREYRESFVATHLTNNISAQIYCTREARGWTQQQLADATGMAQTRICLMENSSYESYTITTLKRLASAYDVALVVRFEPYSHLLDWATQTTPDQMAVCEFNKDSLRPLSAPTTEANQSMVATDGGYGVITIRTDGNGPAITIASFRSAHQATIPYNENSRMIATSRVLAA
jgi:transcriptional regulator with XRE-family HTH domain